MALENTEVAQHAARHDNNAGGVLGQLWTLKYKHRIIMYATIQAKDWDAAMRISERYVKAFGGGAARIISIVPFVMISEKWEAEQLAAEQKEKDDAELARLEKEETAAKKANGGVAKPKPAEKPPTP